VLAQGSGHLLQVIHQPHRGHRLDDAGFDGGSAGATELAAVQSLGDLGVIALQAGFQVGGIIAPAFQGYVVTLILPGLLRSPVAAVAAKSGLNLPQADRLCRLLLLQPADHAVHQIRVQLQLRTAKTQSRRHLWRSRHHRIASNFTPANF